MVNEGGDGSYEILRMGSVWSMIGFSTRTRFPNFSNAVMTLAGQ